MENVECGQMPSFPVENVKLTITLIPRRFCDIRHFEYFQNHMTYPRKNPVSFFQLHISKNFFKHMKDDKIYYFKKIIQILKIFLIDFQYFLKKNIDCILFPLIFTLKIEPIFSISKRRRTGKTCPLLFGFIYHHTVIVIMILVRLGLSQSTLCKWGRFCLQGRTEFMHNWNISVMGGSIGKLKVKFQQILEPFTF